jgi:signal recognition particle subunit SRP19
MRSRKPYIIYWPQYFDAKRSRANGRRVPKKLAVEKVKLSDIAAATKRLGYEIQQESNYKYSKSWWDDAGRLLVDTKGKKKSKVLIEIAKEIKKVNK